MLLEPYSIAEVGRTLERDGAAVGLTLRPHVVRQLRAALEPRLCYGFGQSEYAFRNAERADAEQRHGHQFLQAHYYGLEQIHPLFGQLRDDPSLTRLFGNYFRCEPVWTGTRVWWSYAVDATEEQRRQFGQAFHYDVDDYQSLNLFFYLTDVDLDGGAHVFVRGSHREKKLRHVLKLRRSRKDSEMEHDYGADRLVNLCGPAGYGFVEDPFCFHKALHPHRTDRLILQLRFALTDYESATQYAHSAQLAGAMRS